MTLSAVSFMKGLDGHLWHLERHQNTCVFIYKSKLLRYLTSYVEFRANNHDTRPQKTRALKVSHMNLKLVETGFCFSEPLC